MALNVIRKMGKFHLNISKECLVKWKGKIVKKEDQVQWHWDQEEKKRSQLGRVCTVRCVAFFFFFFFTKLSLPPFSQGRTSRRRAKKLCRHRSRSSFERNVFFPSKKMYDIHWNSFFTHHLIALLLLRWLFFFTRRFRKKKMTKLFVSFTSSGSPVNGHIQPVFLLDHLLFVIWRGSFDPSSHRQMRSNFELNFTVIYLVGDFIGIVIWLFPVELFNWRRNGGFPDWPNGLCIYCLIQLSYSDSNW